jgi:two-component sensor histidine kinase
MIAFWWIVTVLIGAVSGALRDWIQRLKLECNQLKMSLDRKNELLKGMNHRVRGNMEVISSVLDMHAERFQDEQARQIFTECQSQVYSMALIHELFPESEDFIEINMKDYVPRLTTTINELYGNVRKADLNMRVDDVYLDVERAYSLGFIISELMSNSYKHAFEGNPNGQIGIRLCSSNEKEITLSIRDNGRGLPKYIDHNNADTRGFQLISGLVKYQLQGSWNIEGSEGTEHTILFRKPESLQRATA